MSAPSHWAVIAVDEHGTGHGDCGHLHPDAAHATLCEWTPTPWPYRCDLLVRKMRTRGHEVPAPATVRQLGLFDGAAREGSVSTDRDHDLDEVIIERAPAPPAWRREAALDALLELLADQADEKAA